MEKRRPRDAWIQNLYLCYRNGYTDRQCGCLRKENPYREAGRMSKLQCQRFASWDRGWDRANKGLPLDDTNG